MKRVVPALGLLLVAFVLVACSGTAAGPSGPPKSVDPNAIRISSKDLKFSTDILVAPAGGHSRSRTTTRRRRPTTSRSTRTNRQGRRSSPRTRSAGRNSRLRRAGAGRRALLLSMRRPPQYEGDARGQVDGPSGYSRPTSAGQDTFPSTVNRWRRRRWPTRSGPHARTVQRPRMTASPVRFRLPAAICAVGGADCSLRVEIGVPNGSNVGALPPSGRCGTIRACSRSFISRSGTAAWSR